MTGPSPTSPNPSKEVNSMTSIKTIATRALLAAATIAFLVTENAPRIRY